MSTSYLVTSGWAEKLTLCFILIGLVAFARSIYDSLEEVGPAFLRIVGIVLLCLAIPALLCWGALALANSWARTISGLLLVLLLLTPALWLGWRMALTVSLARTKDLPTPTFSDIHFKPGLMVTCVVVFPLLWLALIACTVVWIFGLSESWTLTWLIAAMWGLLAVVLTMSFLVLKHLSKGWTTAIERIAKREWQMSFRSAFMFLPVKSALQRALRKAMGSNA